jgi:hypothetical protein
MEKTLKKLTRPWMIFSLTLSLLVLVLLVLLLIGYSQHLTINTEQLIEEYAKFLGGIVSMLFGFYLVNVLWDQRIKAYQMGRCKKILLHFYLKTRTFCQEIKQLLAKDFSTEENEASQQRDHRVEEVLQKLHALGQGLESYSPEVDLMEDDAIREMAVNNWADIQANLKRLPEGQAFRLDLDEFEETINALIDSTGRAISLLRS